MRDPALELARCIFASPASPDESGSRGQAFPRILIPEESSPCAAWSSAPSGHAKAVRPPPPSDGDV